MKTKLQLLFLCLFVVAAMILLNSCTLTVHPDGSRTYGVDAATAIQILDAK